jgi:hypothetical protein
MKRPLGAWADAIDADIIGGDHRNVSKFLREGYVPTDTEWQWFAWFAPMGTAAQAATLGTTNRLARAINRYRALRQQGVAVDDATATIADEFAQLSQQQIHDYVIAGKSRTALARAKQLTE